MSKLTHLDDAGAAHMVDVSNKAVTRREATATGHIAMSAQALAAIRDGALAKGDALAVARVAGIMATKRTAELVPLCHPLPISSVSVDLTLGDGGIDVVATVATTGQTGVEMEALTAVSVALLTLYDMAKAIDRGMTIRDVRLLAKIGRPLGRLAGAMSLLPVAEAQARMLALATPLPIETVPLTEAAGRWAAGDVIARRTQPAADLSIMDGYAIRFEDMPGPWTVIGESRAGAGFDRRIEPGQAARIFTGAPVPEGADAIMIQEEATRDGDLLRLSGEGPLRAGSSIRPLGSDFREGTRLIQEGALLTPGRIAAAAVGGHGALAVRRKPRIVLISTGDELVMPGEPARGVMLPASNAVMLRAQIGSAGEVHDAGLVPDRLGALEAAFRSARADIIVTTGGASVGDHDLVRPALAEAGAALDFWRIRMRPGKPLLAGRLGEAIVLGLPGNPVSAFVTAQLFLLPLIAKLCGARDPIPATESARLTAPLPQGGARDEYIRATLRAGRVTPLPNQDSGALATLAAADALIVRPADVPPASVDENVDILRIA